MTTTSNTSCLENMMVLLAMRGGSACRCISQGRREGGRGGEYVGPGLLSRARKSR